MQTAYEDRDLVQLNRTVSDTAFEVDRAFMEYLRAEGSRRERSYERVGSARLVSGNPNGMTVEATIRVKRDVAVGANGYQTVIFEPQLIALEYQFRRLGDSWLLGSACRAAVPSVESPLSTAGPTAIPTPLPFSSESFASPTGIPGQVAAQDDQMLMRTRGACGLVAFPF
ncbi:MAG TPA: hypothetical protein VGL20_21395 [Candidatus Dormibacteraeota bacterium]